MTPPQTDSGASSPTGGGSATTSKAKADKISNLVRTRENQRRSRARRREYIADLEAKYRRYEAMGAEASVEIQQAARKVLEENRRLRKVLNDYGLTVEESEEKPTEKLESLLSRKRTLDDDAKESSLSNDKQELRPAPGFQPSVTSAMISGESTRTSMNSTPTGTVQTPLQRQQLSLVTPEVEPGLDNFSRDTWDNQANAVGTQTPVRQVSVRQETWSAPPADTSQTYRQQNWITDLSDMPADAEELAAAAGLSVTDPSMRYLLTDPDTLLEQMYGLSSERLPSEQSTYTDYQMPAGSLSSHSDAEFYWGPSQPPAQQTQPLQQAQHPQINAHQQQLSQMNPPPPMGIARPQQQARQAPNQQYPQGQSYPPPGYHYPQR
ncbi:Hypothetical protein D9617_23g005310 [Elsinoe fawcettii]|nr:Hypothetical protein D9617_23g005310 [Elsinoe fawcettii]